MSNRTDFKIGDKVWHVSRRSVGTVEQNTDQGLFIRFEDWPERVACFADDWFRICPSLLRHAGPNDITLPRPSRKKP